jgi:hypothetical protein
MPMRLAHGFMIIVYNRISNHVPSSFDPNECGIKFMGFELFFLTIREVIFAIHNASNWCRAVFPR